MTKFGQGRFNNPNTIMFEGKNDIGKPTQACEYTEYKYHAIIFLKSILDQRTIRIHW